MMSSSGGISVRKLASEVGVNKNTAASMVKRIKEEMKQDPDVLRRFARIKS